MAAQNPVLVHVVRGPMVESRHRGAAAICDVHGRLVRSWGDVSAPIYPRSAVKPLQALPLVESGAAERYAVSDGEIALAAASHNGESLHTDTVRRWLGRIGLDTGDLACGVHPPMDATTAEALVRAGRSATPLHNNCSGKHAGIMTMALHRGAGTAGYRSPDHPVQKEVVRALCEMGDIDLGDPVIGPDGCGLPTVALPLTALATAFARMAAPPTLSAERGAAARRVVGAMLAHPYMVAGRDRFDTLAIEAAAGAFVVKGGAEGVHAAIVLATGLGVALKIDDGAKRAAEVAMAALLQELGVLDERARVRLAPYLDRPLHNVAGERIGTVCTAPGWPT